MYEVGLGDSPMLIAKRLTGDPGRYPALLAANPHKSIVFVAGTPTFASLGVGERLIVPRSFIGDALMGAFGVGSHEEAFAHLEHAFGTSAPEDAFAMLHRAFGTSDGPCDLAGLGLGDGVLGDLFGDIAHAASSAVSSIGHAAGQAVNTVAKVASGAANEAQKAVASAAKFVSKAGGDATKFVADQAKNFAKDPVGSLTKVATGGPLALLGVTPDTLLKAVGIPTPGEMLNKLGLPDPTSLIHSIGIPSNPADIVKTIGNPQELLSKIPGLNELAKYIPAMPDPTQMAKGLLDAVESGDLDRIKSSVVDVGHQLADAVAMVPGIGNVVGGPLNSALALLESGSPLRAALELLLGQIPGIPGEIRDVFLRPAIDAAADIVEKGKSVTDAFLAGFKDGILTEAHKRGIPEALTNIIESFVDAAIQLIVQHKPLEQVAVGLAKRGLDLAKSKLGGVIPADVQAKVGSLESAYDALKDVGDKAHDAFALTQGIIKLHQLAPGGKNAVVQKQIADLRASLDARRLGQQANKKTLDLKLGPRPKKVIALHLVAPKPAAPPAPAPPAPPPTTVAPAPAPAATPVPPTPAVAPTPPAATPAAPTPPTTAYGPYPGAAGTVSGPPHGHHGGGGHGGGGGRPIHRGGFRGGGWPGWWGPWWGVPWSPDVVTTTQTCQTWGDPIELPPAMVTAARSALGASGGRPTTVRGPDNVLYLFAYENGVLTARPCAAVATTT